MIMCTAVHKTARAKDEPVVSILSKSLVADAISCVSDSIGAGLAPRKGIDGKATWTKEPYGVKSCRHPSP